MNQEISFGNIIREHRKTHDLTQAELARRVGCATITIRKIEAGALRPSVQIAERLAMALNIPLEERAKFVRLARAATLSDPAPSPLPTPPLAPGEVGLEDLSGRAIRGYELGERLAMGGFGAVYRSVQPLLDREVAIKIILPQYANHPDFIRRFEAEAQLVARLEHPYIVPLYDFWREPGVAYLVMRLLRGGSLHSRLQHGPLPLEFSVRLLQQVTNALHSAHRVGVVHRDIKPANILLDEDDNAYLADFGFAKNLGNPNLEYQTQAGEVIGSLEYISPEQIQAEPIRPQADIYCLGVTFYEMLTGRKPFTGPTPIDFIQQHLRQPLPSLAASNNGAAPNAALVALDPVIARATDKNPDHRYPDALALLDDVRRILDNGGAVVSESGKFPSAVVSGGTLELENPYRGLRAFGEADADNFFGRESLTQELLGRLGESHDLARFLAVVGPSGSGKSSLVKAGLIPALRRGGLPGSENWFIVDFMPGAHPLEELEAALLRVAANPPDSLLAQLRENERGLHRALKRILPTDDSVELVLVIDQFEELFTLVDDEDERVHFLSVLVAALLDERSRLRLVITLRADFTDRPLQYVDFGELVRHRAEFVLPLTPDELEQAITQPAARLGLTWEPGLVPTIITDVGDQPGTLPLLQYTLTELFERRDGRRLTLAAYHAGGGVLGTLAHRADELYNNLDDASRKAARQLFLRLVTPGEGTEDTRRRVLRTELTSLDDAPENTTPDALRNAEHAPNPKLQSPISQIIDQFGKYRLLTFDRDPVTREPTVEVAHEALLREWGRLRRWLGESREDIRLQRSLSAAAVEWNQADRDPGFLLHGSRLDQFEGWASNTNLTLTEQEGAYLNASLTARQKQEADEAARLLRELETAQKLAETEARRAAEQTRSARRLRWLAAGLVAFLVVAIGAAWFAFNQQKTAQKNLETAERTRLAAQAQTALDRGEDVVIPALLTLRSLQYGYSPEADAALLSALSRGFARQQFIGHTDALASAVFSPDGRTVLTSANDATARLWDIQTGQEIRRFDGHTELVSNAIFSPDGKYILTSSADHTVRLWDAATGQEIRRLPEHNSPVWALAISPDGQTILTGDESGSAWLWDFQTNQLVHELSGHSDIILWGAFSPDGRTVFTGSLDKTARLWDVETGQETGRFEGHAAAVSGGEFSPDGRFLATASYDNTARLWNVASGQEVRRFIGHTNILQSAVFSPDARYLLTAALDNTARLWNVESGQELRQFIGHTGGVDTAVFSPDGQEVLTASVDRTARLWDISLKSEPRIFSRPFRTIHGADVVWMGFSFDEKQLLTGNGDGTVQAWNIQNGQHIGERRFEIDRLITDFTFSANYALALTAAGDGLARVWDVRSGQELFQLTGHTGAIWTTNFSSDDRLIATGGEDGTARLWDSQNGTELHRLAGHAGTVRAVVFSPDSRFVLTGSDDGLARLWDAQSGQEIGRFAGHTGPVPGAAFSPDGRTILTGSSDQTARLWNIESGQTVRQFIGHTDQVRAVAFSPDGRYVLTGGDDQTARLWDAATGRIVRQLVGHAAPVQTLAFSSDGQLILTGDLQQAYLWQTNLDALIATTCTQLPRDFTPDERALYRITGDAPTCTG